MARGGSVFVYTPLDRSGRAIDIVRVIAFGRRVEFAGWTHGVAVACAALAWLLLPRWWRWPGAALVAGAPLLASVATAFGRDARRSTLTSIGSILAPQRSFRKHQEHLEGQLEALQFPVFGVDGPRPLTIIGFGGDPRLDMLELAHGEFEETGPLVRVATLVIGDGDDLESCRGGLEWQLRHLEHPPPSAEGLSPGEWTEAVYQHHRRAEAAPTLQWRPGTVSVEGQPVPAELARSDRHSAAVLTFDSCLVTVLTRDVAIADLDLRPVDPCSYDLPWGQQQD